MKPADGQEDPGSGGSEDLQARIDTLREQGRRPGPNLLGRAMTFFMSMGVTLAAAMYGGYVLGSMLSHRTGNEIYLPLMLLLSMLAGASVVYQMLKPFLK